MNKVNNFYLFGVLLVLGLSFLQFGCGGDDAPVPIPPPQNERLARTFTLQVGSIIADACTRIGTPRNINRRYTEVEPLRNNPDRLKITMYVRWVGELTGTDYRVDGTLSINKDGANPRFVPNSHSPRLGFSRGWENDINNSMPESLDVPD